MWLAEAENAKIKKGDTFRCGFLLIGQPMYLDDLRQSGREAAVNYVAGSRNGLTKVKVVER